MSKGKCKSITIKDDNAIVTDIGTPKKRNIANTTIIYSLYIVSREKLGG